MTYQLENKNKDTFNVLYDHYAPILFGEIVRIVGSEKIAEEILTETFMKIWKNYSSEKTSNGRLLTWMLGLARKTATEKLPLTRIHKNKLHIPSRMLTRKKDKYRMYIPVESSLTLM